MLYKTLEVSTDAFTMDYIFTIWKYGYLKWGTQGMGDSGNGGPWEWGTLGMADPNP
jgi:hypothetical protein